MSRDALLLLTAAGWLGSVIVGAIGWLIHPVAGLGIASGSAFLCGLFVRDLQYAENERAAEDMILRRLQEAANAPHAENNRR